MTKAKTDTQGMRVPFFQGILPVKGSQVPADVIAGLTLAAVSIPQMMAYTKIAGTPVITGLYTILIPLTLFALFGSSRHLVVGADSSTAPILAGGITGMAVAGSAEWLALAGVLAFLSAGFLIIARIIRLAFLADFLSRTVLVGFLTGIGVQVALGEIAGMLGLAGGGHGAIHQITNDLQQIEQTNVYALAISVAVLVAIVGSKQISTKIPGALIAVMGTQLGKQTLEDVAKVAHPDTMLSWHRQLVAQKFDGATQRTSLGRPRIEKALEDLVRRMAKEHRAWG
jgi:SulP family sulfate permease